jgi:hypothetical protein
VVGKCVRKFRGISLKRKNLRKSQKQTLRKSQERTRRVTRKSHERTRGRDFCHFSRKTRREKVQKLSQVSGLERSSHEVQFQTVATRLGFGIQEMNQNTDTYDNHRVEGGRGRDTDSIGLILKFMTRELDLQGG